MNNSRQAKWRKERKAQGLCVQCGKGPLATVNHCADCRDKNRASCRARYRTANGISLDKEIKSGRPRKS